MNRYAIVLAAGKGTRMQSVDPDHQPQAGVFAKNRPDQQAGRRGVHPQDLSAYPECHHAQIQCCRLRQDDPGNRPGGALRANQAATCPGAGP